MCAGQEQFWGTGGGHGETDADIVYILDGVF